MFRNSLKLVNFLELLIRILKKKIIKSIISELLKGIRKVVLLKSHYVLGRSREHNFVAMARRHGWFAHRCTGSGGGEPREKVRPIDIICLKKGFEPRLVQVSKKRKDITASEITELKRLAEKTGAIPLLSYKNNNRFESIDARDNSPVEW